MALTRKMLKAMGIEDEKIEEIIEAHTEVTDALKKQRDEYKESAEKLPDVQRQLDELKGAEPDEFKGKYEAEHKAFEEYKSQVEADKAKAAKESLYRALLKDAGVDEKRIDTIVRVTDFSGIEVDGDKLKDSDKLTEGVKKEWADFIPSTGAKGADVENPPSGGGNGDGEPDLGSMSMEDYIKARTGK